MDDPQKPACNQQPYPDSPQESSSDPAPRLSRRTFLGAAGAAAASAAFLGRFAKADNTPYYFLDSFGNVDPVAQEIIDMGIYPPPILPQINENQAQMERGFGPGAADTPIRWTLVREWSKALGAITWMTRLVLAPIRRRCLRAIRNTTFCWSWSIN